MLSHAIEGVEGKSAPAFIPPDSVKLVFLASSPPPQCERINLQGWIRKWSRGSSANSANGTT